MKYNLIVAMCKFNNGIGLNGKMPWHIKEDLKYFYKMTMGSGKNAVIMGSNTYKSLGTNGLQGRDNIVLSSTLQLNHTLKNKDNVDTNNTVKTFKDTYSAIQECLANNYDTVWIIGGGSIYRQFIKMNIISKCYVTLIHKLFICDTTFPLLSLYDWTIEKVDEVISDNYDFKVEFMVYTIINHNVDYQ